MKSIVVVSLFASVMLGAGAARAACGSGLACEVCNVSGFSTDMMQPPIASQASCTDADLDDFYTACIATTATSSTCASFQQNKTHASCTSCLFTMKTATKWGLLVCDAISCSINIEGCVDVLLGQVKDEHANAGSGSCGDLLHASYGCQGYACGQCSTSDFTACDTSAEKNECESYAAAVDSSTNACANIASVAAQCQPSDAASWKAMGTLMCGAPPAADAGTPPPADAATSPSDAGTTTKDAAHQEEDAGGSFEGSHGGGCSSSGGEPGTFAWLVAIGAVVARMRRKLRQ